MHEGKIALDLARPAPFLGQLLAHQVGATASTLPFVVLALPFAVVFGGIDLPQSLVGRLALSAQPGTWLSGRRADGPADRAARLLDHGDRWGVYDLRFHQPVLWRRAGATLVLPGMAASRGRTAAVPGSDVHPAVDLHWDNWPASRHSRRSALQVFWVIALSGIAWLVWQRAMRRVVIQGG